MTRSCTVEPVRDGKKLAAITKMLHENPRNQCLWVLGINNGLRAADLVRVKVAEVAHLKPGETLTVLETKTGKTNVLAVNKTSYKAIQALLRGREGLSDEDWLFPSRKGGSHLKSQAVSVMVKSWCEAVGLSGRYGAHTLRKTWAYHQRMVYGVSWEIICKRLNHSSPAITMRYLGIEDKEVTDALMHEIG